jgi:hypothetical protein
MLVPKVHNVGIVSESHNSPIWNVIFKHISWLESLRGLVGLRCLSIASQTVDEDDATVS